MIPSLLNQGKLLWAVAPANYNGAAATHKMVCLKNYQRMYVVILTGGWALGSAAVTLNQATAVAGTGEKSLAFSEYYHDETTSGTLVKETCTNTFNLDTANKMYVIDIDPASLDGANGFDCCTVEIATPGANDDYYGVAYILYQNRFADPTPPTALTD